MGGTPEYMAPEQISTRRISHQTDLYSFGVMLYEMLAGSLPFQGIDRNAIMQAHVRGKYKKIDQVNKKVTKKLSRIISCLLAHNPKDRYPNIANFIIQFSPKVIDGALIDINRQNDERSRI
jgi:eukaryotic-like serine/threonine-protein kinase